MPLVFLWALLGLFGAEALAQPRFTARLDDGGLVLLGRLRASKKSGPCTLRIFSAAVARGVRRHNKTQLVAKRSDRASTAFRISTTQPLHAGERVFLRGEARCGQERGEASRIVRLRGSGTSLGLSSRDWIQAVHASSLRAAFRLTDPYPSLRFAAPVDLQSAEGVLHVVEQAGAIQQITEAGRSITFLDIRDRVLSGGERGLLGLAFHPEYHRNGNLFVNYTRLPDGATVISRFTRGSNGTVDASTELPILVVEQPFENHNGGQLQIGPDGNLYIALGDGGGGGDPLNHAQNRNTLLGSILRLNVDDASATEPYRVPSSNPFVRAQDGSRPEIFAYGLRNPWRFSFDPRNGRMWIADVGQGSREEVNIGVAGGNFGWNLTEGSQCFLTDCGTAGLILPVAEYGREEGTSVTGGYVYRGVQSPLYDGLYFYGDFGSGKIWVLPPRRTPGSPIEIADTLHAISSFGLAPDGELLLLSYEAGTVHRIVQ